MIQCQAWMVAFSVVLEVFLALDVKMGYDLFHLARHKKNEAGRSTTQAILIMFHALPQISRAKYHASWKEADVDRDQCSSIRSAYCHPSRRSRIGKLLNASSILTQHALSTAGWWVLAKDGAHINITAYSTKTSSSKALRVDDWLLRVLPSTADRPGRLHRWFGCNSEPPRCLRSSVRFSQSEHEISYHRDAADSAARADHVR